MDKGKELSPFSLCGGAAELDIYTVVARCFTVVDYIFHYSSATGELLLLNISIAASNHCARFGTMVGFSVVDWEGCLSLERLFTVRFGAKRLSKSEVEVKLGRSV